MSGAYKTGNYEIFVPQNTKGKYQKYSNQLVAIVSVSEDNKGRLKTAKLYLTDETDKEMGHPKFLQLGTSGSNVGLIPLPENNGECYVVNRRKHNGEITGMPFVNITAFAKFIDLEKGVYNAHPEPGGVIEFNRKSKPSRA